MAAEESTEQPVQPPTVTLRSMHKSMCSMCRALGSLILTLTNPPTIPTVVTTSNDRSPLSFYSRGAATFQVNNFMYGSECPMQRLPPCSFDNIDSGSGGSGLSSEQLERLEDECIRSGGERTWEGAVDPLDQAVENVEYEGRVLEALVQRAGLQGLSTDELKVILKRKREQNAEMRAWARKAADKLDAVEKKLGQR